MPAATHVLWATGGSLVPQAQFDGFMARGGALRGSADLPPDSDIGP